MPTLLIIDDDELITDMISYILTPILDGVTLLFRHDISNDLISLNPTLVLSDLDLGTSSGETTLTRLRGVFPVEPLVIMSGMEPVQIQDWIRDYRIAHFIPKDTLMPNLGPLVEVCGLAPRALDTKAG